MVRLLRNSGGQVMGLLVQFGRRGTPEVAALAPEPVRALWRVCNICGDNDAVVYCQTHSVYTCLECIQAHEIMDGSKIVTQTNGYTLVSSTQDLANRCHYLSRTVATALAE